MTTSGQAGLEQAVLALRGSASGTDPVAVAVAGGWIAIRVGRNDVWKLTRRSEAGGARYAKFYRSDADFRRELAGLQLALKLAEGRDWLMAARVLLADEQDRVIVTESLPGMPISRLIRTALRLGQPRRARARALEQARRAISLLVDWVALLQAQPPDSVGDLQDDRPGAVAGRIAEKLARLPPRTIPNASGILSAGPLVIPPRDGEPEVLTHGDLSSGNVFYQDGRVGVVDFENMGVGLGSRDVLWIHYGLEQCNFRWYYRDSAVLLALLDTPHPDDPIAGLYRMEFVIDHLLILEARLGARPWRELVLGLAERRWVRREFGRLSRLPAGG